jgi:uncharacterized protein (TIGR00369 family)
MHRGGARADVAPAPPRPPPRLAKSPYNAWLGLTVTSVGEDTIEMTAKWREEWVVNPAGGYTHGGILAALVDVVADYAIAVKNGNPVPTIDLRVDYHRAAKGDLKCTGKIVRFGGQFTCAEAYVYDAAGAGARERLSPPWPTRRKTSASSSTACAKPASWST